MAPFLSYVCIQSLMWQWRVEVLNYCHCLLADLQGAEVFMKVQGLAQGHSGRVACTQLIHGKISVDAARSWVLLWAVCKNPGSTNKMFDLIKLVYNMQTRSLHLPSTSTLQIWDLCFLDFSSMASGTKKRVVAGGWIDRCFLLVLRSKGQPCSLIHTPPTHVEDWVGSPSESFKRSCKSL